jgi:hypothetical protein
MYLSNFDFDNKSIAWSTLILRYQCVIITTRENIELELLDRAYDLNELTENSAKIFLMSSRLVRISKYLEKTLLNGNSDCIRKGLDYVFFITA